jgi:2-C-methyl-D-erythritol 4-phosphate cytidylyltransferase / 2-C-methyl-D-erythritol 2,4-cyclodiphosphate synthase
MSGSTRTVALIVAGGTGTRFGGDTPKQMAELAGKPLIQHSIDRLSSHPSIDEVVIVGDEVVLRPAAGSCRIVPGGSTRRLSVSAGLQALVENTPAHVLVHDAARPLVQATVVDRLLHALSDHVAAIPGLPVVDSVIRNDESVERDGLVRVQTPQAFRFGVILAAHEGWTSDEPTDDASMVRAAGHKVAVVEGDARTEKVTYPADLAKLDAGMPTMSITGHGYDVHRLAPGLPLWIGGVQIPHSHGAVGHSDADVALHAITDAILGALGEGDIGQHFPPSDPKWRGAASGQFVEHALKLVAAAGGQLVHVDVTLICEAPKIGPHRSAMRERMAALLRLPLGRVSVKATTTEGLGFTGRAEGIAAQATATVILPRSF